MLDKDALFKKLFQAFHFLVHTAYSTIHNITPQIMSSKQKEHVYRLHNLYNKVRYDCMVRSNPVDPLMVDKISDTAARVAEVFGVLNSSFPFRSENNDPYQLYLVKFLNLVSNAAKSAFDFHLAIDSCVIDETYMNLSTLLNNLKAIPEELKEEKIKEVNK